MSPLAAWVLATTVAALRLGAAGIAMRKAQAGVYPTSWEQTIGNGKVVMDTFLFPDPLVGADVFAAARAWCLNKTHVVIVGARMTLSLGEHTPDLQFRCLFHREGGEELLTDGSLYPPHECRGLDIKENYQPAEMDHILVCEVPDLILKGYAAEGEARDHVAVTLLAHQIVPEQRGSKVHFGAPGDASPVLRAQGLGDIGAYTASRLQTGVKYRLAITHMYKNHGPQISEWIRWHHAKGVEHFFLYDNGSDEDDNKHLLPYEEAGIVTRIKWTYCCSGPDNSAGQRGALNHALFKFGHLTEWLLSLDGDEFLTTEFRSIVDTLDRVSTNQTAFVGVDLSFAMVAGCDEALGGSAEGLMSGRRVFGSVAVSQRCPPQMLEYVLSGKLFVRPMLAYQLGFVYSSPHALHLHSSAHMVNLKKEMTIAHFRTPHKMSKRCHSCSTKPFDKADWHVKMFETDFVAFGWGGNSSILA